MADNQSTNQTKDRELEDLLDSALKDFSKEAKLDKGNATKVDAVDKNESDPLEDVCTSEFIKQTMDQFHEDLQIFIRNGALKDFGKEAKLDEGNATKVDAVDKNESDPSEDVCTLEFIKQTMDQFHDDLRIFIRNGALKNFGKDEKLEKGDATKADAVESSTDKSESDALEDAWTSDFIKRTTDQFHEDMRVLSRNECGGLGTDGDLSGSLSRLAQPVASAMKDEDGLVEDSPRRDDGYTKFQSVIARALDDLSAMSENLQGEVDLSEAFGQTSLEDGSGNMLLFMQGLLQRLLTKEILYPALKQLVAEFPELLEEKKATIPPSDLQRFEKQLELMQQACKIFDEEKEGDSEEEKKKRLEKVLSLMDKVLACGQLPEELVGKQVFSDGDGDFTISALAQTMQSPQNCCIM